MSSSSTTDRFSVEQLHSWSLLGDFRRVLAKVPRGKCPDPPCRGQVRLLSEEDYLCSFLFAMFNPIIDSMRGLCAASDMDKVQERVCHRHISLGSFSDAQRVFGSERVEEVFRLLALEKRERSPGQRAALPDLTLVDSSVFRAVTRMTWAHWRSQNGNQSAVRLHLKFHLFDGEPSGASVTKARHCERKALEEMICPGEFYVGDRYYGRDYQMLKRFEEAGSGYLFRTSNVAHIETVEELPLTPADRDAGVVWDRIVNLGARNCWHHGPVRMLRIEKDDLDEPIQLVTNWKDQERFSAEMAAQAYRQRWAIELFFRWLKCVLGRPARWHWMAESEAGVAIQLYASLIAALLLSRRLGKLPNKRTIEMLRFHALGMISDQELEGVLKRAIATKTGSH